MLLRRSAIFTIFLFLASCGGGGGGADGGQTGGGGPTSNTSQGTLLINSGNAEVVGLSIALSEGVLEYTQMIANVVVQFGSQAGTPVSGCYNNNGQVEVQHTDNDSDFGVSAGDSLRIIWTDCFGYASIDADANGAIDVLVSDFSIDTTSVRFAGTVSIDPGFVISDNATPPATVSIVGNFDMLFEIAAQETLQAIGTGTQFIDLGIDGFTEKLSSFNISRIATAPVVGQQYNEIDTEVGIDVRYNSGALGGSVTCKSTQWQFAAGFSGQPSNGFITCTGLNLSAVRLTGSENVSLDPEGDGSFAAFGTLQWSGVSDGFLKWNSQLRLDELVGNIATRKIAIATNDVVYDEANDRFLMTTTSTSTLLPNSLVSLSIATNSIEALLSFNDEPNLIGLSADAGLIYLTHTGLDYVRKIDATTLGELSQLTLRGDLPFSNEIAIEDFDVSPTNANQYVALVRYVPTGNTDLIVVDNDVQLAGTPRTRSQDPLAQNLADAIYLRDGQRVLAGRYTMNVASDGINSWTEYDNFFPGDVKRHGNRLYGARHAYDGDTLTKLGNYRLSGNLLGIDTSNARAYSVDSSEQLYAFSLDRYQPIANFDLTIADGLSLRDILVGSNHVVLVEDSQLSLIDTAQIVEGVAGECDAITLQTSEQENYLRFACPVMDAVYDPIRDKIYVAVDSTMGQNGNSIAIINATTDLVEDYVYVGSEPIELALSNDGVHLNVIFSGADVLTTLDLNTLQIVREVQVPLARTFPGVERFEPESLGSIVAATSESDTVVVALHEQSGSPLTGFAAYRGGVRLNDIITTIELRAQNSSPIDQVVSFSASGAMNFVAADADYFAVVQNVTLGPTGISLGSFYNAAPAQVQGWNRVEVDGEEIFTIDGSIIDLASASGEKRFDISASSAFSNIVADYVSADVSAGKMYFLALTNNDYPVISRYDYSTGAFESEQVLEAYFNYSGKTALVKVGADKLAFGSRIPNIGLIVIEKGIVQ